MQGEKGYNVGGVMYPRPFKIRRLGHFGFNVNDLKKGADFYGRLLGFRITDDLDIRTLGTKFDNLEDGRVLFMTHNADHHAFLLAHRSLGAIFGDDAESADVTLNQITWQVNTLEEVVNAVGYFNKKDVTLRRMGRDMPGSNWHVYVRDPDGHTIELYYGMEQVGWDGLSKPTELYYRRFNESPPLPQVSEKTEVEQAAETGIDVFSGYRRQDIGTGDYVVGAVRLPRPFKITRIGPVKIFVGDVGASEAFYTETLGFQRTEVVTYKGHR